MHEEAPPAAVDANAPDVESEPEWVGDDFGDWDQEEEESASVDEVTPAELVEENEGRERRRSRTRRRGSRRSRRAVGPGPAAGTVLLGATIALASSGGDISDQRASAELDDESSFRIVPEIGYFVGPNLVIQAGPIFAGSSRSSGESLATLDNRTFGALGRVAYYHFAGDSEGFFVFGQALAAAASGEITGTTSDGQILLPTDVATVGLGAGIGVGVVAGNFYLRSGLDYGYDWGSISDSTASLDISLHGFSFSTSLGYVIH